MRQHYNSFSFVTVLATLTLGVTAFMVYDQFRKDRKSQSYDEIVKRKTLEYLKNPINQRPFLWIYVDNVDPSQIPVYKRLCIETIIKNCDDSFNIILLDDSAVKDMLPHWSVPIERLLGPTKMYYRYLAQLELLYEYGGFILPPSFLCIRDLKEMYVSNVLQKKKMIVGENVNPGPDFTQRFIVDPRLVASEKENMILKTYIDFVRRKAQEDTTGETWFDNDYATWCTSRIQNGHINMIDGSYLGTKDRNGNVVTIESLVGESAKPPQLSSFVNGIWIPSDQLEDRTQFRVYLSMPLESNTYLGTMFRMVLGRGEGCDNNDHDNEDVGLNLHADVMESERPQPPVLMKDSILAPFF